MAKQRIKRSDLLAALTRINNSRGTGRIISIGKNSYKVQRQYGTAMYSYKIRDGRVFAQGTSLILSARKKNPEIHIDIHSHNTKGRNVRAKNPGARFSASQLARLRSAYAKIEGINPSGKSYWKLIAYLDGMTQPQLKQLADADIKFMSALARNRIRK